MKFMKCCGRICVVLDMLVLIPIFGTNKTHNSSGHTLSFISTWAYVCSVGDAGANTNVKH